MNEGGRRIVRNRELLKKGGKEEKERGGKEEKQSVGRG